MIHNSHTRRDVVDLIETFDLDVKHDGIDKTILFNNVSECLLKMNDLHGSVDDLQHIRDYLKNINQNKIKISDRDKFIDIAKSIIFYVKNGCLLSYTDYLSEDFLKKDVREICKHCTLPTCLRAVNMLNQSHKFDEFFIPILTGKTKVLLRRKREARLKKMNNLRWRSREDNNGEPFIVRFD